jgi:hypothetical protein
MLQHLKYTEGIDGENAPTDRISISENSMNLTHFFPSISGLRLVLLLSLVNFVTCSQFSSRVADNETNRLLRDYFLPRRCIKYLSHEQPFRFDDQPGQVDITHQLRLVVSIVALDHVRHRHEDQVYRGFPLYFLLVSPIDPQLIYSKSDA